MVRPSGSVNEFGGGVSNASLGRLMKNCRPSSRLHLRPSIGYLVFNVAAAVIAPMCAIA